MLNHRKYIEEQSDGHYGHPAEEQFFAEMNALVVKDAEEYYRTMMLEDTRSWNLRSAATFNFELLVVAHSVVRSRDDHFARTLVNIANHLDSTDVDRSSSPAKIIVWAHNSHNGDARATDMGRRRGLQCGVSALDN